MYGTPDSHRRYADEIAKWQDRQTEPTANVTIKQLTLLYLKRCENHYRKDGKITSEVHCVRSALRHVNRLYRDEPADQFNPMMLAQVRAAMVSSEKYVRYTINKAVGRIVRCWKWGVSQGLVRVATYQALMTLQGLQEGRCDCPEGEPVEPVSLADVEAVLPLLAIPLQGAARFQLATASRPNEALQLRLRDLDRSGAVWIYRPGSHKTTHHGKDRLILVGPRAQAVILDHATADPEAYVFGVPGSGGKKAYRRDNYALAIRRGCERVFEMPKELRRLKRDDPEDQKQRAKEWRQEHVWTPNQLRHTAATAIRKAAGTVEAAKVILGHAELRTTEIYAERDLAAAAEIVNKVG